MISIQNLFRLTLGLILILLCCACTAAPTTPVLPVNTPTVQEPTALPSASPTLIPPTRTPVPPTKTAVPETATPSLAPTATPMPSPTRVVKTVVVARENTPVPQPAAPITPDNANQVTALAVWGNGSANDLAYSPDGNTLAVASSLGIYLYDDNSYRLDVIETGQVNTSLDFSPDGEILAVGDAKGKITLWRWRKKEIIKVLDSGDDRLIQHLQFSPLGDAIGYSKEVAISVIRIKDGAQLFEGGVSDSAGFIFSRDGKFIFTSVYLSIQRISLSTGKSETFTQADQDDRPPGISALALSPDGKILAGSNRETHFWETQAGHPVGPASTGSYTSRNFYLAPSCEGHMEWGWGIFTTSIDFSPDSQSIAVGMVDNAIEIQRIQDRKPLAYTPPNKRSVGATGKILKIRYHPFKPKIIVLHSDGLIEEIDSQTAKVLQRIAGHPQRYSTAVISPATSSNQALLAVGASSEIVQIWDLTSGQSRVKLDGQANNLAFFPDGSTLAVGDKNWNIEQVSLSGSKPKAPLQGHLDQVTGLTYIQGGKMLVSGSVDCTVRLWDISTNPPRESQKPLKIPLSNSQVLASPDGEWVAVLADDVYLLKVTDPQPYVLTAVESMRSASSIAFSADSKILAAKLNSRLVVLIDLASGQVVKTWSAIGDLIAFSPGGKILAIGDSTGNLTLTDTQTGKDIYVFPAHRAEITSLVFSNDGRILISTGADGTVRLWGVMSQ